MQPCEADRAPERYYNQMTMPGKQSQHNLRLYQLNQAIYERGTKPAYHVIASYQTGICFDATTQLITIVNGEESWGNM